MAKLSRFAHKQLVIEFIIQESRFFSVWVHFITIMESGLPHFFSLTNLYFISSAKKNIIENEISKRTYFQNKKIKIETLSPLLRLKKSESIQRKSLTVKADLTVGTDITE